MFVIWTGAKLPLYAFKRQNQIVGDKCLAGPESTEPPVDFLESLLLGEVSLSKAAEKQWLNHFFPAYYYCINQAWIKSWCELKLFPISL